MDANRDRKPILAVSWIVELPRDIGLPDDSRIDLLAPGDLHGWAEGDIPALPRWNEAIGDQHPRVALRFRRAKVPIGMPTESTDRCFGEMQIAHMSWLQRRRFERNLNRLSKNGVDEWKTVVRITKWYGIQELPGGNGGRTSDDELDAWMRREFRGGLVILNKWLASYGLAKPDLLYGPLALTDLPSVVPTVMEGKDEPSNDVSYSHRLTPIHDEVPALVAPAADVAAAEAAARAVSNTDSENPFLDALLLLFGAQRDLASARGRQAIIDSGTGVEMLISAVLRSVGARRPSFDAEKALRSDFRGRFEHHFPKALGDGSSAAPDLDGARSDWWSNGYETRNAVVHEGRFATNELASRAVESAWKCVDASGRLLADTSDTADLGRLLAVVWHGRWDCRKQ